MPRPISVTISLPALRHNLSTVMTRLLASSEAVRQTMPQVWAVMKADAYGHGLLNALYAFGQAQGVAMLDMNEAVRCRQAGWTGPLLLLEGFFEPADILVAAQYNLTVAVHTQEQLDMLMAAHPVRPLDIFLKLNTGMNRLGFAPQDYRQAYSQAQQAQAQGLVRHLGKMTHFASADDSPDVTAAQIAVFNQITDGLPGSVSVCNSAATLTDSLWATLKGAQSQWVRPGICLYGASPFARISAHALDLRPAQTLAAELISVRTIGVGDAIGYGQLFTADGPMRIGVVACGYADGYPRHAPTGTPITVDGVRTRILGRVSMDMLVADLTAVPQARVGSKVVLWGRGGPSVDEVAHASGTIGYELLCAVAPRVPRLVVQ
ncbi:alanine racemase [Alcaligenaceae bacterium]|nr:alanine racemase [Alcaligenaceae bacterium]